MLKCFLLSFGLGVLVMPTFAAEAHAYNIKTGEMLSARFTGKYSGHGKVFLENAQHKLSGEWSVVQDGDYAWGNVFATAGTQTASASGYVEHRSMMMRGRASVAEDGLYLRCEFVSSGLRGHGHGACQDNHGDAYDLLF